MKNYNSNKKIVKIMEKLFHNTSEEKRIADAAFDTMSENDYVSKYTSIYIGAFGHLSTLEHELKKAGFRNIPEYIKVKYINEYATILTGFGKTSGYAIVYQNIFGNKSICVNKSINIYDEHMNFRSESYGDDTQTVGVESIYSWWYGTDSNTDITKNHDCEVISAATVK